MARIKCPACQAIISTAAALCPRCGSPLTEKDIIKGPNGTVVFIIVGCLIVLAAIFFTVFRG